MTFTIRRVYRTTWIRPGLRMAGYLAYRELMDSAVVLVAIVLAAR